MVARSLLFSALRALVAVAAKSDELTERIRLAVTKACGNCVLHAYDGHSDSPASYLIHQLADSVVVSRRPSGGTSVVMRFEMRLRRINVPFVTNYAEIE